MAPTLEYERSWSRGRSSVVEHNLAMVGVVSSSLIARSTRSSYMITTRDMALGLNITSSR